MNNAPLTPSFMTAYTTSKHNSKGEIILNVNTASYLTLPSPCGLAISSVTSDGEFLYALQPDRKTIYKLDVCGRIVCTFTLSRKYISIHFCSGKFYALAEGDCKRVYILNKCLREISSASPDFSTPCTSCRTSSCCSTASATLGPAGECTSTSCMITIAKNGTAYVADGNIRIIATLASANNGTYTAIAENNGVLFEAIQKNDGCGDVVRATLLSDGQSKVQRLPNGIKIRSFFCYGGYLYAFFTKNSFHGFIAPICTFIANGNLCGEIVPVPDDDSSLSCALQSCGNTCGCTCSTCASTVSSNQTEMCSGVVSGDSTDSNDCDVTELCRLFDCIKRLCKNNGCAGNSCSCGSCGCNSCVSGGSSGCANGNLSCSCYPKCDCDCSGGDVGGDSCLPLPPCPQSPCCTEASTPATIQQMPKK